MNPGHQPQRFLVFTVLPNRKSFTIKDSTHVFSLDKQGGWFDQYNNYYNSNGEADQPPSSRQSSQGDKESYGSGSDSDEYQKEFGKPGKYQDDEQNHEEKEIAAVAQNLSDLQMYPKKASVRVYFQNLGPFTKRNDLLNVYSQNVKNILNVVLEKVGNKNKGTGHFILSDRESATNLVHLQGKKIIERPLYFTVQKYEDNLLNVITQEEIQQKDDSKKYTVKEKKEEKQEKPKKIQIPWKWYKFQKDCFPKKSDFKQWMQDHGLVFQQDFKNVQKIQDDLEKKYAKIEMKESTFNSINGLDFQGKKVVFVLLGN